jgi:thiol-disulfide isomerase/thioredoxin
MKFAKIIPGIFLVTMMSAMLPAAAQVAAPLIAGPVNPAVPAPYDVNANGMADVDAALARAKANGKRLLIDLGGNWCPDCRILAGIIETPQIHPFLARYFEIVTVDVGRYDKNLDVPARFGIGKPSAAPTILIVSPETATVINSEKSRDLRSARSMDPQAVVDWLASWAKDPA